MLMLSYCVLLLLGIALATNDALHVSSAPVAINYYGNSFLVSLPFTSDATENRVVVVALYSTSSDSKHGEAATTIGKETSGTAQVSIAPTGLTEYHTYYLVAFMTSNDAYYGSSGYTKLATTEHSQSIMCGKSVVYAEAVDTPIDTSDPDSTNTGTTILYAGTALSGGEFGTAGEPLVPYPYPGRYGDDYIYPDGEEAIYFAKKGMNTFRIPFLWERLQSRLSLPIIEAELDRLKNTVEYITDKLGGYVVLDLHNYGRYNGQIIGESSVTQYEFSQFWGSLAAEFVGNDKILFGLMNEPYNVKVETWVATANMAIAAIRNAGAPHPILVPGARWSTGVSWSYTDEYGISNAEAMLEIEDPEDNFYYEIHQYFDSDSSGKQSKCESANIGSQYLDDVTHWLRHHKKRGFLGEFGATSSDTCLLAIDDMLRFLNNNADAWVGWTWWAAGGWFEGYEFSIQVYDGVESKQMAAIEIYLLEPLDTNSSFWEELKMTHYLLFAAGMVGVLLCCMMCCNCKQQNKHPSGKRQPDYDDEDDDW